MSRTKLVATVVACVGLAAAGCSATHSDASSSNSSSASGHPPALCSSVHELQASVDQLRNVNLGQGGLQALQTQLAAVNGDLQQVIGDASAQYRTQVDRIKADLATVKTAAGAAVADPGAATLAAIRPALTTVVNDVNALGDQVSKGCS
jgi:hypothetical protein